MHYPSRDAPAETTDPPRDNTQVGPGDTLIQGSRIQGRSSIELNWDGVVIEGRFAQAIDQAESTLEHHHIVLFQVPLITEREYRSGRFTREVKRPGTVSMGLAGRLPAIRSRDSLKAIVCTMNPMTVRRVLDESDQGGYRKLYEHVGTPDKTLATLLELAAREANEGGPNGLLYANSISYAIISRFVHVASFEGGKKPVENPLPQPSLRRVLDKIRGEYDRNLSLTELADESGYSRAHFIRMFRTATGKTPHQYLCDLRLERAREQLLSGSASILEIALMTGFASHSHLTRLFRQRFGTTPSSFRRIALS
jgi:AraC family transcriptional regulator